MSFKPIARPGDDRVCQKTSKPITRPGDDRVCQKSSKPITRPGDDRVCQKTGHTSLFQKNSSSKNNNKSGNIERIEDLLNTAKMQPFS